MCLTAFAASATAQTNSYPWHPNYDASQSIEKRIQPPPGYHRHLHHRPDVEPGSFADWLRHLPLKKGSPPVRLFNGEKKGNQDAHVAVVDIDVGTRDLQQCADAVMRLRAEYLFSIGKKDDIHFNLGDGKPAAFKKWAAGYRPSVKGDVVRWSQTAGEDSSYASFRKFMDFIFAYAGSASLSRELKKADSIEIGDVLIHGGSPGHAVIVVDCVNMEPWGQHICLYLLAQSYMPAQEIQILKNPHGTHFSGGGDDISPWYSELHLVDEKVVTPEWTFGPDERKRFERVPGETAP